MEEPIKLMKTLSCAPWLVVHFVSKVVFNSNSSMILPITKFYKVLKPIFFVNCCVGVIYKCLLADPGKAIGCYADTLEDN